jgi:hypothetical protein
MSSVEAAAWRERIAIWRRFRVRGEAQSPQPVADIPPLDDPDPFLPSSCAEPPDSQQRQLQAIRSEPTRSSRIDVLRSCGIVSTAASASSRSFSPRTASEIAAKSAFQLGERLSILPIPFDQPCLVALLSVVGYT